MDSEEKEENRTAMSIRNTTNVYIQFLRILPKAGKSSFTLKNWIDSGSGFFCSLVVLRHKETAEGFICCVDEPKH